MIKHSFLIIGIIGFSLIIFPLAHAQLTADIKYKRVEFIFIYDAAKTLEADLLVLESDREKVKYELEESKDPTRTPHEPQVQVSGFLTFKSDADATTYYNKIINNVNANDLVYGEILLLDNNHHVKNPDPDVVLDSRTFGDKNAVIIP